LSAPYPFGFIGDGLTRCVTLALPSAQVGALLPPGLELGEQSVTPAGTHPLLFLFHDFDHCQYSFPTLLRHMTFHEQTAGIPFTCLSSHRDSGQTGPYYFMPKLYLDDLWVQFNGRLLWGFNKEMASVDVTESRYIVTSVGGRRLASLNWSAFDDVESKPVAECPEFGPVREMLSQTLVTAFPATAGPFFALTDFERRWNFGTLRPLHTTLEVDEAYMPGFPGGRWSAPASFELTAPWWLSLPYRPLLAALR
jgi:hypothetical protein